METKISRVRDPKGKVVPGLWAGESVRMEKVEDGWEFQVPAREVGQTNFFEFRPITMGGAWRTAGVRRTLEACIWAAEKLVSGEYVLRPASGTKGDRIPACLVDWSEVADEIAAHPSVRGSVPVQRGAGKCAS